MSKHKPIYKLHRGRFLVMSTARRLKIKGTLTALDRIELKGFVFTDDLTVFSEVLGYLKSNQIPYQIIDGSPNWLYAIRRLDRKVGRKQ